MQLNKAQQEAVDYIKGPCLVLAGAGSGKTRVIITKIVHLLRSQTVQPSQILAVTFTNKAAAEMRDRIAQEVSSDVAEQLTISTFHALGRIIVQEQADILKISRHFTIFDDNDTENVLKIIIQDNPDLAAYKTAKYSDLKNRISLAKGRLKTPRDLEASDDVRDKDPLFQLLYKRYFEYLRACNAIDFDDLLFIPTRLFLFRPDIREKYQDRFRYILVDEYQDTNDTQYYLLLCLVAKYQCFTVVGDDDQSIYSWRGARPENIAKLAHEFPQLKVIKLEQNYRSTSHILRCANSIIANNNHLFKKNLYSSLGEGRKVHVVTCKTNDMACEWITAQIMGHRFDNHKKWSDYAVLYRSNSQARDMEKACLLARIPCKVTGDTSFFDRAEVKDILAWCRLINNVRDNAAFLRIINIPHRGIGPQTLKSLNELSFKYKRPLFDCACSVELQSHLSKPQFNSLCEFLGILIHMRTMLEEGKATELCDSMIDLIHYKQYLNASFKEESIEWRLRNAQTILNWIRDLVDKTKEGMTFDDALAKLGLREKLESQDNEEKDDKIQLMTLHAAKGLEFPYVYLLGMEEGILPHRVSIEENNIEEERRLAYVGVTRARLELTMVLAAERKTLGGGALPTPQQPSRFIAEMPSEDIEIFSEFSEMLKLTKEHYQQSLEHSINELKELL